MYVFISLSMLFVLSLTEQDPLGVTHEGENGVILVSPYNRG